MVQAVSIAENLGLQAVVGTIFLILSYSFLTSLFDPNSLSLAREEISVVIFLVTLLIIFVVFLAVILVFVQSTSQDVRAQMNRDFRLIVSTSGVVNESSTQRVEVHWSGIKKIIQTRKALLIYFSERSAFLISKTSFPNESEAQSFYRYTLDLWKGSK